MSVLFDVYMGGLVVKVITEECGEIEFPYALVTVRYGLDGDLIPFFVVSAFREFEEALEEMDDIDGDSPWDFTVLKMSLKGSTVVWSNMLPMTPVTQ
jgi:hypothetical protein